MAENNPNVPFTKHPGQKAKTVPISAFKGIFRDEVMDDLSVAVRSVETHERLPAAHPAASGEYPAGSSGWYNVTYDEWRKKGIFIPHRDDLKGYASCDPSDGCPSGVAKKAKDGTSKPILTVQELVRISLTDARYQPHLTSRNMRELHAAQSAEFAVPSIPFYYFLLEGKTHPAQTHKVVASGRLIPLKTPGTLGNDSSDDDANDQGNGAIVGANPDILNNPSVVQALGIVQNGMVASHGIVATNNKAVTVNEKAVTVNEKAQQDIHNGMSFAFGLLSAGAGLSSQAIIERGRSIMGPTLPPIGENQPLNQPLPLPPPPPAAPLLAASNSDAGNDVTPKKAAKRTPKKKTPTPKKKTPQKRPPASPAPSTPQSKGSRASTPQSKRSRASTPQSKRSRASTPQSTPSRSSNRLAGLKPDIDMNELD